MSKSPKPSIIDRDLIHELTALLDETGLTEIEIEQDGKRIRVARRTTVAPLPRRAWKSPHGCRGRRHSQSILPNILAW